MGNTGGGEFSCAILTTRGNAPAPQALLVTAGGLLLEGGGDDAPGAGEEEEATRLASASASSRMRAPIVGLRSPAASSFWSAQSKAEGRKRWREGWLMRKSHMDSGTRSGRKRNQTEERSVETKGEKKGREGW